MNYDLLLPLYDYHCNLFIEGKICFEYFQAIETEYIKRQKLFTVCLN